MAFGATALPVLVASGPVQAIAGRNVCGRIKMIPSLSFGVPSDVENLQAPFFGLDQILLKRRDPNGVPDFKRRQLSIGSVGFDEIFAVLPEEARGDLLLVERRIIEIADDIFRRCLAQRPPMVRISPRLVLGLVASATNSTPGIAALCGG